MENALYLVPVPLSQEFSAGENERAIPEWNAKIIGRIRKFIVESRKMAVRFLISLDRNFPIDECRFAELSEHTRENSGFLEFVREIRTKGESAAVISDAGCPAIGDPGNLAVAEAHREGIKVVPLSGPNSMVMALMSSGMNGQNFAFNGYLPAKPGEREARIRALEARARKEGQTQIFIEAPYRNERLLDAFLGACKAETRLCVASGLTTEKEFIRTKMVGEWRKCERPKIDKIPTIFLIL